MGTNVSLYNRCVPIDLSLYKSMQIIQWFWSYGQTKKERTEANKVFISTPFLREKFHKRSRILIKIIYIILKFIFMYIIFISIYIYVYIKKAPSWCFNRSKPTPSRHGNRCGSYGADVVPPIDQYLTAVYALHRIRF